MASIYHEKYKGLEEIMRETGSFKRSSAICKAIALSKEIPRKHPVCYKNTRKSDIPWIKTNTVIICRINKTFNTIIMHCFSL